MKPGIHPEYHQVEATCVCGNVILTGSTNAAIKMEICSACHPFFTGTQKIVDTEGRVEKFKKRYTQTEGVRTAKKSKKEKKEEAAQQAAAQAQQSAAEAAQPAAEAQPQPEEAQQPAEAVPEAQTQETAPEAAETEQTS